MVAVSDIDKGKASLIAWRFSKPTSLPMYDRKMELFPCNISGTPNIEGISVEVGQSWYLTEKVQILPSFICLARVYGPAS